MARLVPDIITKLTYRGLVDALRVALPFMSNAGIILLAAHIAHETGMGSCHCNNPGNVKSNGGADGRDWCMFECGEEVLLSAASLMRHEHPDLISFVGGPYTKDGKQYQSIKVKPPHPWSRFRAYATLDEGVKDYLRVLRLPRYAKAWAVVTEGLVTPFAKALRDGGYFTAGLDGYISGTRRAMLEVRGALLGFPTLKRGQKNDAEIVKKWQMLLGFRDADVDGDFGKKTEAATKAYQSNHGLLSDGWVGPITWATALPAVEVL